MIIVPSAVVIVSLPANPVPSFATAYTYAIFLFPVILSAYLISKSLTFAVVVVLSVLVRPDNNTLENVFSFPSNVNVLSGLEVVISIPLSL